MRHLNNIVLIEFFTSQYMNAASLVLFFLSMERRWGSFHCSRRRRRYHCITKRITMRERFKFKNSIENLLSRNPK